MSISLRKMTLIESSFSKEDIVFNTFRKAMEYSMPSMYWGPLHNQLVALAKSSYFKDKFFVVNCKGDENTEWDFDSREDDWSDEQWDGHPNDEDKERYLNVAENYFRLSIANPEYVKKIDELKKLTSPSEKRDFCEKNGIPIFRETRELSRYNYGGGCIISRDEHTDYVPVYGGADVEIWTWQEEY